jgi:hypothetical protein
VRRTAKIACIAACTALLGAASARAATPFSQPEPLAEAMRLRGVLEEPLTQVPDVLELVKRGVVNRLEFENHDGYRLEVFAYGQTVLLGVARNHGRSIAVYLAHGTVTPTAIRASLADRGRIDLRFRPSGRVLRLPGRLGCVGRGREAIARRGVYLGLLRFRGEGRYTAADAHRIGGSSLRAVPQDACRRKAPRKRRRSRLPARRLAAGSAAQPPGVATHPAAGPKLTTLVADGKLPLSRTLFASQRRGPGRAHFLAVEESSVGPIAIVRYAIAPAPSSAFVADDALSLARVTPPPPFGGSAALLRGAGGAESWTGSLTVSFLGAPRVPLTGSLFRTWLTRSW